MENYQKSTLLMNSLFNQEEQEYLKYAVKAVNDTVSEGYSVDSAEVKRRFRLFLLMIRQMFLVKKRVPENHYGKNFMHVTDEVLLKEAKELYTKMKKAKG